MLSDIEIAHNSKMLPISEIAENMGIAPENLELYGNYKAKLSESAIRSYEKYCDGKLVLVTAINPTPAGEGKTTMSIGLADALRREGKNAVLALREPSLGPVFGIKGGAAGGGYSQVVPMEDINLHFTGDMHAITSANNLLCAMLDNHIHQGNKLDIDVRQIKIKRCMDMNDRQLRFTVDGLGGKVNGVPREDSFEITVATEVMAILCLAKDLKDLKERLGNILVAYNRSGEPVYAKDLKAQGAMTALLKDALKPNLVQTLEHTPCFIHGGPFANIAHGCNSVRATRLALKLGDYAVTEAGFGADLGAEKFLDIKCRYAGIKPSCVVLVATARALKYNGGVPKDKLLEENTEALKKGIANLGVHIKNMQSYGLPVVVAINKFYADTDAEIEIIKEYTKQFGVETSVCEAFTKGGEGGRDLASKVIKLCEKSSEFKFLYDLDSDIKQKVNIIAKEIYHAKDVEFSKKALKSISQIEKDGYKNVPVCIAKTQYSLSDDPTLLGAPSGHTLHVTDVSINAGAGFAVIYTGNIMTMPGLPKKPAAENIDCDENGIISGLF